MFIDISQAPFVYIREEVESSIPVTEQIQQLLAQDQPFVLITNHRHDDHQDETAEERKEKALFFKKVKERMRQLCRGMIVVEGEKPIPAAMRLVAATASKAFGFAVKFAASEEQAIQQGRELLAGDQ
ncbi:hypothetical protein [Massilia sp. YIM B04103]|uniref:hypothetical protein n=1 Tax=Massilia sp. YIM B04103 TaxID=2963106 RepID=UPI00210A8BA8|nr:hypothetical protein [Massilia sp. YIM B04103]